MRREGVAQRVWGHALLDLRALGRELDGLVDGLPAQPRARIPTGKQLGPCRPRLLPVAAEHFQQALRQHGVPVTIALAIAHMDHHALAVDILYAELAHLTDAQARAVRRHHDGLELHRAELRQQPLHFLNAQDRRQMMVDLHVTDPSDFLRALKRGCVQKPERRRVHVVGRWLHLPLVDQVEQEFAHLASAHCHRRLAEVLHERRRADEVGFARVDAQAAQLEVAFHLVS